jgi:hypothetical protein
MKRLKFFRVLESVEFSLNFWKSKMGHFHIFSIGQGGFSTFWGVIFIFLQSGRGFSNFSGGHPH